MKWKRDLSTSFWHTVNFSILFWWKFDNGQPEVAGFQTFSNGFEFCSFFFCLLPPSISVAPWNSNVPLRLTQVTCLQKEVSPKKNAWEKQCQIKKFVWHKLLVFKKKFRPRKKCLKKTMPDKKNFAWQKLLVTKKTFCSLLVFGSEARRSCCGWKP